jgi:Zn-dependent protease with chaperone function
MSKEDNQTNLSKLSLTDAVWAFSSMVSILLTFACLLLSTVALAYGMWWLITNASGKVSMRATALLAFMLYMSLRTLIWRPQPPIGMPMSEGRTRKLNELVMQVAEAVKAQKPNSVYLTPDCTIGAYEDARLLQLKGDVALTIGIVALDWLSVGELRSLIAHELAHFSYQQPLWISFPAKIGLRFLRFTYCLRTQTKLWWLSPTWWLLWLLTPIYTLASYGVIRRYELNADAIASHRYGATALISALQKYGVVKILFDGVMHGISERLAMERKSLTDMVKAFRELHGRLFKNELLEQIRTELLLTPSNPLSLHVSLSERLNELKRVESQPRFNDSNLRAISLLDDPENLSMELSQLYAAALHHLFFPLRKRKEAEGEEERDR